MTAVLDGIRRLEASHARGEISTIELAAAKADLLESIPDITPIDRDPEDTGANHVRVRDMWQILMFCFVVLVASAGLALVLTGDMLLSATLAITVLAAFSIILFRQIDI